MAAPPSTALPTTGQKLTAEALGTPMAIGSAVFAIIIILEMQGFSVTVRGLTPQLTRLRDAPVDTPALRWER